MGTGILFQGDEKYLCDFISIKLHLFIGAKLNTNNESEPLNFKILKRFKQNK